jgi:hypothetical protein
MKNDVNDPTEKELEAAYAEQFPRCRIGPAERLFLTFILVARSRGVGYGWMRQAIGIAWKLADPVGYIDDDRIIELHRKDRP